MAQEATIALRPRPGVEDKDSQARLLDMDREGRDVDLMYPGNWAPPLATLDPVLQQALYGAFHRYIQEFCSVDPDRLKSMALLPCGDVPWSVAEAALAGGGEVARWGLADAA